MLFVEFGELLIGAVDLFRFFLGLTACGIVLAKSVWMPETHLGFVGVAQILPGIAWPDAEETIVFLVFHHKDWIEWLTKRNGALSGAVRISCQGNLLM